MSALDKIAKKKSLSPEDLDEIETEFDPKHIVWRLTAEIRRLSERLQSEDADDRA